MATTITNRASLRYTYGAVTETVASNTANTVVNDPLTVSKSSLESAYRAGEPITYLITVTNGSDATLTNVTITDDLGAFEPSAGLTVTPLTYTGPAKLYQSGVFSAELTPAVAQDSVSFTVPSIPPAANVTILYKATPNEYAPMDVGSEITNTASFAPTVSEPITAQHTVPADAYAAVTIEKEMTPNPVTGSGPLVNTFTITNTGNVAATDLVLSDTFNPQLSDLTVTVNGAPAAASDYTYENGVLTLPAEESALALTVPAATFVIDPTTGVITSTPGVTTVTVTGTL